MSDTQQIPDESFVETAWSTFESHECYSTIRSETVREIDERCKGELNSGNYDPAISLKELYSWFEEEYLDDDHPFKNDVLEGDLYFEVLEYGESQIARLLFQRLVEVLDEDDELIYVYDRQRVRSRVAEIARYFALMRQRLNENVKYQHAPSLVKLVKMDVIDREQPIFEENKASKLRRPIWETKDRLTDDDINPAPEFERVMGDEWRTVVGDSLDQFTDFLEDGLPDEFDSLAKYQTRAFVELFLHAVTDQQGEPSISHSITASTGGGKTEAFLFPTLAYCLTAHNAGLSGNKAILTYPRRDLCNNQFERLFKYAFAINMQQDNVHATFEAAPITVGIQHGSRSSVSFDCPHQGCSGEVHPEDQDRGSNDDSFQCDHEREHRFDWATTDRKTPADLIVTTQNSLHLRMMDYYGSQSLWDAKHPTKFLILDEVHVYTEQAGMHVANVVRRFQQALREKRYDQTPALVASSATIANAREFTRRIFGTDRAKRIEPREDEKKKTGSEYIIFVKATDPRDIEIPVGDSVFKPKSEWDDVTHTTASNLSCMIQIGFGFYHTMRKETAGSREGLDVDKNRILGFVDSIDSVSRLGGNIQETEKESELYKLRRPDATLDHEGTNPDCPKEQFQHGRDPELDERAVCDAVTPNRHLNKCPVYEAGECWWTMRSPLDLTGMRVAIHKSGQTMYAGSDGVRDVGDEWEQMISTSALEVGFDHPGIIGTFQYRAPRNIPGFVQRKGRGGRDAEDKPVTVVVLGSTPTDAFYFHHSEYLSRPEMREENLQIQLDETNRFIQSEHMTAAVFDYFNVTPEINASRLYSGPRQAKGPEIEELREELTSHRSRIEQWLAETFDASSDEITTVLQELEEYIERLTEPVVPDKEETPFWEFFRQAVHEAGNTGTHDRTDELLMELRDEDERNDQ
jgi:hypothetical protein